MKAVVVLTINLWGAIAFAQPPNIIAISLDTLRADHLSFCGYDRETSPHLSQLAGESLVFTDGYASSSWTLPSHGSFFSGLPPWRHDLIDWDSRIDEAIPLLSEKLRRAGYWCEAIVHRYPLHRKYGFARGFHHYDDYSTSVAGLHVETLEELQPNETVTSAVVTRAAIQWLQQHTEKRPFFLFLHYFDIHNDYLPPGEYSRMFDPDYRGIVNGVVPGPKALKLGTEDHKHLVALYDGEIAWVDFQLGELFDEMKRLGLWENTLVAIFSDHGEEFGEHGGYLHAYTLYQEVVRIPIVLSWPRARLRGHVANVPVSLEQLHATLLRTTGIETVPDGVPDLLEIADNSSLYALRSVAGSLDIHGSLAFVRQGKWKLIHDRDTRSSRLFDLGEDPCEKINIAADKPRITSTLCGILEQTGAIGNSEDNDREVIDHSREDLDSLRALGYF